jgi:signal transduction histidine kinase
MRLAFKIFAATTLVILALVGVAGGSLLAVDRLVGAHRETVTHFLPALQLEASLRESLARLLRLEARYLGLGDHSFGDVLMQRSRKTISDLDRLGPLLTSEAQRSVHRDAVAALGEYQRHVEAAGMLLRSGKAREALQISEGPAREAARRFDQSLSELTDVTVLELDRAQAGVRALERRTWTAVLVALAASLLAAVVATAFVAVRTTRSVRRLSDAMATVAGGSFRGPLSIETSDEIGDLTRSFNRMAEQLREADALKEQFFAHISHEIRNPLTAIGASAQLLLERTRDVLDAKQRRWLELINISVDRLLRLLGQILDFNRLRAGVFPLERRSVRLDEIVAKALDVLRPQAEQQSLLVETAATGTDFVVVADEEALTKVVVNLVGNAIKFIPAGGAIRVAVRDADAQVELTVEDNGPGIPAGDLDRIFEPYQQAHNGRRGSGLGLAIVKQLIDAHGGSVGVDSQERKGTCFTVRLPRTSVV